jgi:hypothetical protein
MRLAALIALMLSGGAFADSYTVTNAMHTNSWGVLHFVTPKLVKVELETAGVTTTLLSYTDSAMYRADSIKATSFDIIDESCDEVFAYITNDWYAIQDISRDCVTTNDRPATLVAPDIAIGSGHLYYSVGQQITFGGETAIVTEVKWMDDYRVTVHDFTFLRLDRELTVQPAILAPTNWPEYLNLVDTGIPDYPAGSYSGLACLNVRLNGWVSPMQLGNLESDWGSAGKVTGDIREDMYWSMQTGDSGCPLFITLNDRLILIGIFNTRARFCIPFVDLMEVERGWGL